MTPITLGLGAALTIAGISWWSERGARQAAEARIRFLEQQHRTNKVRLATYLAELDAVTEATRPVPGWYDRELAAIHDLPEAEGRR